MSLRRGLLLGAAGFGLAGLVLKPLGVALIGMPSAAWALVAVAALSVGVLEEGTRAVLLRAAGYPAGRTLAGVALGWGLAELLLVGVAGWVQLRTLAAQPELLTRIAADMPVAAAAALQRQVQAVADGSAWTLAGGLMERLAALTHDHTPPQGACNTWRALYAGTAQLTNDLISHIHLENNVLFPRFGA